MVSRSLAEDKYEVLEFRYSYLIARLGPWIWMLR